MTLRSLDGSMLVLGGSDNRRGLRPIGRPRALVSRLPSPFYIAHRGGATQAAEGSLTAYRASYAQGAHALEFDVRLTSDSVMVPMHDATVDRTTNGTTGNVSAMTAATFATLTMDHAGLVGGTWSGTENPPTIAQLLAEFGNKVVLCPQFYDTAALTPFDAVVGSLGINRNSIIIQSSSPSFTASAIALGYSNIMCTLSTISGITPSTLASQGYNFAAPPEAGLTQQFVTDCHTAGIKVVPFETKSRWRRDSLLALGCDGILSDDAGYLRGGTSSLTDQFTVQKPVLGHHLIQGTRGGWISPNEFGIATNPGGVPVTRFGYMTPTDPNNFVLTFEAQATVTSPWNFIWLGKSDYWVNGSGVGTGVDGYLLTIKDTGVIRLESESNGTRVSYLAFDVSTGTYNVGTWYPWRMTVTSGSIKVERTDIGFSQTYATTSTNLIRPLPYLLSTHAGFKLRNVTYN